MTQADRKAPAEARGTRAAKWVQLSRPTSAALSECCWWCEGRRHSRRHASEKVEVCMRVHMGNTCPRGLHGSAAIAIGTAARHRQIRSGQCMGRGAAPAGGPGGSQPRGLL
jgi:hypothetical protein